MHRDILLEALPSQCSEYGRRRRRMLPISSTEAVQFPLRIEPDL